MIDLAAAFTYAVTASLGITAFYTKRRFGRWHHALFFLTVVANLIAVAEGPSWELLAPFLVLVAMPFTKGGTKNHIRLGYAGFIVWGVVLVLR